MVLSNFARLWVGKFTDKLAGVVVGQRNKNKFVELERPSSSLLSYDIVVVLAGGENENAARLLLYSPAPAHGEKQNAHFHAVLSCFPLLSQFPAIITALFRYATEIAIPR